jgi:flagellar secretion chaperone FliS
MRNVTTAYLETQVLTATPERLHLLVVDAAIRFARQGEAALEAKDIETAFFALDNCRACVTEILGRINAAPNPDLAERLKGLFVFVQRNLVYADLKRDPQLVREARAILETHRQTWLALMERVLQEKTALRGPHAAEVAETSWTT